MNSQDTRRATDNNSENSENRRGSIQNYLPVFRKTVSIYKMIGDIISLAKESEQKSKEVVIEKRRGDLLLYDVSMRRKSICFVSC